MQPYDRMKQLIAVLMGAVFVIPGFAVLFGDPKNVQTAATSDFHAMIRDLTGLLGESGAGLLLIAVGLVLGVVMFRAASR